MGWPIQAGATDQSTIVRALDATGMPTETFDASATGLKVYYRRDGSDRVAISPITDLVNLDDPHADGGLRLIAAGYYRLDVPDVAFATGAAGVLITVSANDFTIVGNYHPLPKFPPLDELAVEVPGTFPSGTAGHSLGRIGSAPIEVTGPLHQTGNIEIVAGDDYLAADGRALDFLDSGNKWPDLTGASITFTAKGKANDISKAGSVIVATGSGKKVRVELTKTETSVANGRYHYDVEATLPSGNIVTLVHGRNLMEVLPQYTT